MPSPHNKQSITVRPTQTNSETSNRTFSANAHLSPILESQIDKNPKFEIKLSHLNIRSLKNRDHIVQLRLLVRQIRHEIITISETWLNSTVSNADIELEGYKILRLDRLGKAGGGVCMYYRNDLKVSHLKELSSISSLGFRELWVKIHHRKLRSIIVCVTERSSSLIDVIMTSNSSLIVENGTLDAHLSDHYLVFSVLNLKIPKPAPVYITARNYKNYDSNSFLKDLTQIN